MYFQNLSPERRHSSVVTVKADIYAAGWVFFEVLCGLSPLLFRESTLDDDFAKSEALPVLHKQPSCVAGC